MSFDGINPLGFETTEDVNLFKLFAESQAAEVTIPDDTQKTPAKDAATPTEEVPPATPAKTVEEDPANKQLLEELLKRGVVEDEEEVEKPKDTKTDDKTDAPETAIGVIYDELVTGGILSKVEGFDGSAEGLRAAMEATLEERLDERVNEHIETAFSKRPEQAEIAKELISFLGKGGQLADFIETRKHMGLSAESLDAEDEGQRINSATRILTSYYQSLNWDADRIKRTVDRNMQKGVEFIVEEARDVYPEYEKAAAAKKAAFDKQLDDTNKARQESVAQFNNTLRESITNTPELLGFELTTKKAKSELEDYLFKPTVEVNGRKIPQFYADRQQKQNTPEFLLAQALLLKNNFKINETKVESRVTSTLEQRLKELGKNKVSSAIGNSTDNKNRGSKGPSLVDLTSEEVRL